MDKEEMVRDLRQIEDELKKVLELIEQESENDNLKIPIIELETRMKTFIDNDYGMSHRV